MLPRRRRLLVEGRAVGPAEGRGAEGAPGRARGGAELLDRGLLLRLRRAAALLRPALPLLAPRGLRLAHGQRLAPRLLLAPGFLLLPLRLRRPPRELLLKHPGRESRILLLALLLLHGQRLAT